jgi:HAD superfamily hydrolase (TIGR01549 family)
MTLSVQREPLFLAKPDAVILDMDNCLYYYDSPHRVAMGAVIQKASEVLGVTEKRFLSAFSEARLEVKSQLRDTGSSHSRLLYFQRTFEILGLKSQIIMSMDFEQTYWRTFLGNIELFSGVKELLFDLRNMDISIGVVTDLTSQIQFRKVVFLGLDNLIDYFVSSEEAGKDKPNAAPFKLILDKMGLQGEKVWMVGDDPEKDIKGAKALKMVTLQKRHNGVKMLSGIDMPDAYFDEFEDLQHFIQNRPWL